MTRSTAKSPQIGRRMVPVRARARAGRRHVQRAACTGEGAGASWPAAGLVQTEISSFSLAWSDRIFPRVRGKGNIPARPSIASELIGMGNAAKASPKELRIGAKAITGNYFCR